MYGLRITVLIFAVTVSLVGCAVSVDRINTEPPIDLPNAWSRSDAPAVPISQSWLDDFNEPKLTALVAEAMGANFDLHAATARVAVARAQAVIEGAGRFPEISAAISGARSKRNTAGGSAITSTRSNTFATNLDIAWEPDVWGRLSNRARASAFDLEASKTDLLAARLSLAAGIAKTWFDIKETQLQVQLAAQTVENFRNNQQIIEEGFRDGINSALEVRLARANVASAQNQLALQRGRRDARIRALEGLLGRYPAGELQTSAELPKVTRDIPVGLPSELLERRPDIVTAELRLAAADERVQQASKNRLPSIRLTATGGTSTTEFKDLLDTDFLIYTIAANLAAPLFQGGRLTAEQERAVANADESLADYAQVLLRAFQEVETALTADRLLAEQETALDKAKEESVAAEVLALEEYRSGLVDIITLLEAQRRSFNSQSSLIEVANQRVQNRIDLYLALGGDFSASISARPDTPGTDTKPAKVASQTSDETVN